MPLHNVGYRGWDGIRSWSSTRWIIIAITGIQLVWRGTWIRRVTFTTWLPALFLSLIFLLYEQSANDLATRGFVERLISSFSGSGELIQKFHSDPQKARHEVWATTLLTFFRYPQAFIMVVFVGLISPRLISFDLRSRAYLLYFSRPLKPWEYILGKAAIIWFYLSLITMIPALLMYVLGILLSPSLSVFLDTWDLPVRIVAATVVFAIPTTLLALAYSAMTLESRYAAFAWITTWVFGAVTYGTLTAGNMLRLGRPRGRRMRAVSDPEMAKQLEEAMSQWEFVSPYHLLGRVEQAIFGQAPTETPILLYGFILMVVTLVCLSLIHYRIRKHLQA